MGCWTVHGHYVEGSRVSPLVYSVRLRDQAVSHARWVVLDWCVARLCWVSVCSPARARAWPTCGLCLVISRDQGYPIVLSELPMADVLARS